MRAAAGELDHRLGRDRRRGRRRCARRRARGRARASASSTSTATTAAPSAVAIISADRPTPPQPWTATQSPAPTRPCSVTAANAVMKRQPRLAASTKPSASGSRTRFRSARGSATSSANEPQRREARAGSRGRRSACGRRGTARSARSRSRTARSRGRRPRTRAPRARPPRPRRRARARARAAARSPGRGPSSRASRCGRRRSRAPRTTTPSGCRRGVGDVFDVQWLAERAHHSRSQLRVLIACQSDVRHARPPVGVKPGAVCRLSGVDDPSVEHHRALARRHGRAPHPPARAGPGDPADGLRGRGRVVPRRPDAARPAPRVRGDRRRDRRRRHARPARRPRAAARRRRRRSASPWPTC